MIDYFLQWIPVAAQAVVAQQIQIVQGGGCIFDLQPPLAQLFQLISKREPRLEWFQGMHLTLLQAL